MQTHENINAALKLQYGSLLKADMAAAYLGTTKSNLKTARHTGLLWGETAPEFLKIGRTIRYRRETLAAWASQFTQVKNTSDR